MRAPSSLLRTSSRQAVGRICDRCRQQQQQQTPRHLVRCLSTTTTTTRNTYAPRSSGDHSLPISKHNLQHQPQQKRLFSSTNRPQQEAQPQAQEQEQPAKSNTPHSHYDFFPTTLPQGPPPSGAFDIDVRALRREFLQLQAKAHPDMHPPAHKARAEATSALINEAFKTLSDPLLRAQYLVQLLTGHDVAGDERAKTEDKELLMEVMEAREVIEEAESEEELDGLRKWNDEMVGESVGRLGELLKGEGEGVDWDKVKEECVRLRYWRNIGESIRDWERGKGIVLQH